MDELIIMITDDKLEKTQQLMVRHWLEMVKRETRE